MSKLDFFLNFLFQNRNDSRIQIRKKKKYGFRYYEIHFTIDSQSSDGRIISGDFIEIIIDNRNECIEIFEGHKENYLIEDKELVTKWSNIIEEWLMEDMDTKITNLFEDAFSNCYNKNLHREYQMKKIFTKDESL
jgi:hypothetical protein